MKEISPSKMTDFFPRHFQLCKRKKEKIPRKKETKKKETKLSRKSEGVRGKSSAARIRNNLCFFNNLICISNSRDSSTFPSLKNARSPSPFSTNLFTPPFLLRISQKGLFDFPKTLENLLRHQFPDVPSGNGYSFREMHILPFY